MNLHQKTAEAYTDPKTYNPYCTDVLSASDVGDIRSAANTLYISYRMGAEVKFVAKNINGPTDGNETPTNKNVPSPPFRYTDAKRTVAVDIVGRIGALTMIDTGDYRLSNTFKSITTKC